MPSQSAHEALDVILFGSAHPDVHRNKDTAIGEMFIAHRLFGHDPFYNLRTSHPPSAFAHDLADLATLPLTPLLWLIDPKLVVD